MKKVYISGPISGLTREDYMARFAYAEQLLKKEGYKVVNPTRLAPCRWLWLYRLMGYNLTLLYDLWHLMRCDCILMLPGWVRSKGARIEYDVAYALKIKDIDYDGSRYCGKVDKFIKNQKITTITINYKEFCNNTNIK